ncbi:MAG: AmmeMemoRadiSam system protein A [Gammaproteobacteria bacterium]|nr:AmmeMemoRadiSam system protein A [Gammaproteobacteria bacterium]MDX5374204.1 AmmeMemoRadiSam system protein A [Gammaproteobacteria bacterium]
MAEASLDTGERRQLLVIARQSIEQGLHGGEPLRLAQDDLPPRLRETGGTFVTLRRHGELRGCIGTLEPHQPLAQDVAEHAFAAAFRDPRFPPLRADELDDLTIDIAILGPAEELVFQDEADLVRQLRPGADGLILQEGARRGTFLPSVWEQLPDPAEFLRQLKRKAGLPADHWSDTLRVWRYGVEVVGG